VVGSGNDEADEWAPLIIVNDNATGSPGMCVGGLRWDEVGGTEDSNDSIERTPQSHTLLLCGQCGGVCEAV
jgi:hypothetical protein